MLKDSVFTGLAALLATIGATYCLQKRTKKSPPPNTLHLPAVDLNIFFNKDKDPELYQAECKRVAEALHKYGIVIVKDPRVVESDTSSFIDMMERYFGLSDGKRDARPEHAYQVGVTPSNIERPLSACSTFGAYGPDDQPLTLCPPEKDPKWRFFWRIGKSPKDTKFPSLSANPVIPPEIPEWSDNMNSYGNKMVNAVKALAEMAAVGFGMEPDSFVGMMECASHLLAPTGSDFSKYGKVGTVLAGYHYDLNFFTIHGKSRFPGLSAWSREGKKLSVAIPDGCLLVQAGKQIEYCTAGHVLAGFHEVVCTEQTAAVIERKKAAGESLWRVSATLFGHLQADSKLRPLPPFNTPEAMQKYPEKFVGEQVSEELKAINLDQSGSTQLKKD